MTAFTWSFLNSSYSMRIGTRNSPAEERTSIRAVFREIGGHVLAEFAAAREHLFPELNTLASVRSRWVMVWK